MNTPEFDDHGHEDMLPAESSASTNERPKGSHGRYHPTTAFPIAVTASAILLVAFFTVTALSGESTRQTRGEALVTATGDQARASFERERNHVPALAHRVTRESIDDDVLLYQMADAVHWTEDETMKRAVESCAQFVPRQRHREFEAQSEPVKSAMRRCIAHQFSSERY